jgi:uncharacterized membrane protein
MILLAQTRQADRDKAHADADAQHREALSLASLERQAVAEQQATQLMELMRVNTELAKLTKALTERVETFTAEIHGRMMRTE